MKKEKQNQQRMVVVKKTRKVKKYVYKPKTFQKKVIRMVKVIRMDNKVKYINKQIRRKATRMVTQRNTVKK